jgi:DNA-binding protein HU-beta
LTCGLKTSFIAWNFPERQEVAVNRSELVESVREQAGLENRQADGAVKALIETVIAQIRSGQKVSVFGFGTFNPTSRAARTGRNPQTGAPVKIAASKSVRFAPAAAFKTALNAKAGAKKAAPAKKTAPAKKATAAKKVAAVKKASTKKAAKATKATKKR